VDQQGENMSALREFQSKFGIGGELLVFLWQRKMFWMIPMVLVLLLFGILIAVGSATGVGPFVYTLF
jgi:hypothetical protein